MVSAILARPATKRGSRTKSAPPQSPETIAPELEALVVPIASLTQYPNNPRRSSLEAISDSLVRFGQLRPVVVQRSTGYLVAGNHLVQAATALGWRNVAAAVVELDDASAAAFLLADNRSTDLGSYDDALLAALLEEQAAAGNLAGTGYGQDDIDELLARLLAEAERKGDPDAVLDLPDETEMYVEPGQRWRLGRQVLLCGDALNPDDVARCLDGAKPTLLCADPAYGVRLDNRWRDGVTGPHPRGGRGSAHRTTMIAGDDRIDWSAAFALVPSLEVGYVWHAGIHAAAVADGLASIGFEIVSQVIWDKGLFALGRSWWQWAHEPCWVVRKHGAKVAFYGARNQATIWRAPSPKMVAGGSTEERLDHPTQKPVLLYEVPMAAHLRGSDAAFDPCCGSGTSLLAAERLGRRCYALEIEPRFVQLAIERWQRYTGERATCEEIA